MLATLPTFCIELALIEHQPFVLDISPHTPKIRQTRDYFHCVQVSEMSLEFHRHI